MYDLQQVIPDAIYEEPTLPVTIISVHSQKEQVVVGDNITIQEPPSRTKKVQFLMDISAGDYPCSLYAVEAGFGASYDKTLLDQTAPIVYPPPETMSWKQRLALKSCFFLLISLPFLMVAIIQPWNDTPAAHSHDIYQQQNETIPIV
jgi:hypothetical protein